MAQKAYVIDPNDEIVTVGGIEIDGYPASGDRVTIAYRNPAAEAFGGSTPGYNINADRSATLTLNLVSGSRAHAKLLAFFTAQRGAVIQGVLVQRKQTGAETFAADSCVVEKVADVRWGTGELVYTWTFQIAHLVGGPTGLPNAPTINPSDI